MSKKLSRFIAGILLACMVAGSIPAQAAYGAAANTEIEEGAVQDLPENVQDTEETTTAPASDGVVESSVDAGENEINFVYIESPYLETPGTQRIVFSFEQQIMGTHVVTLTVENEAGSREEWELSQQTDHLYLFEKEYSGDAYTGTYRAVSLNYYGEENKTVVLEDAGVEAEFGVNEEYNGIEELQPLDSETAEDVESQVEASVVTIDENGVTRAQDSIAAALNEVSADTARISTYSAAPQEKSGNIVVALDPGHDSSDAGARGNGLKEEELTLKIANYCKEELEQYAGVSVYMTRTGPDCPYGIWGVGCIEKRVQAAANAGAQIFVSFHLNASVSSSANGAEVIVPNYSWKYSVGAEGHTLGQVILDELVKLGLTNRGIYSKDTTINERYPDGSISDYFGVQIYCKEQGIPGIIVEHAFISNSGDANKFLTTEAGLKQLGVADATGIAKYLGLSKGRWETDSNGNTYYFENGTKVFGEKLISGKWYYFDPQNNGAMKTGWHDLPGKRVYYANTGEMLYGEQLIEGKWYCFEAFTGKMITGWYDLPEKRVYYAATGEMVYGQQEIEGEVYYFELFTGAMYRSGWRTENGKKVYYLSSGKRAKGEVCIDNSWRYFDEKTGEMVTGWHKFPEKTVYYSQDGRMLYGEQLIEGKWYCFNSGTGAMITGWHNLPEKRVYYAATGEMLYGEQLINNKWFYLELGTGKMLVNIWINGAYYGPDGARVDDANISSYSIEGTANTTVAQMVKFYEKYSPISYPSSKLKVGGAPTLESFALIYYEEAIKENIRPEVAWCQSMLETGYLKFGGQVKIEQFNFAGLGATDGGAAGADFSIYGENGVRMGVRAQIQHLKAYASSTASKETLAEQCVDPRFDLVSPKGCASDVIYLGQKENPIGKGWATAERYGYHILDLILRLLEV